MQTRMESFESEVTRIVNVEIVQLVKFLVQMHEGPELGSLAPTFKEKKEERRGREKGGMEGWKEKGKKKIKKEGWKGGRDSAVHL